MATTAEATMSAPAEKKTRPPNMVRVKQEYIDWIKTHYPQKRFLPVTEVNLEEIPEPEIREEFHALRATWSQALALMKSIEDKDMEILAQYNDKGYAEVVDEDEDGEDDDEEEDGYVDGEGDGRRGSGAACWSL
ncbi:hypothetical protein ACP70R_008718 [Stipagrostis hirtigluma subsp. patula]